MGICAVILIAIIALIIYLSTNENTRENTMVIVQNSTTVY